MLTNIFWVNPEIAFLFSLLFLIACLAFLCLTFYVFFLHFVDFYGPSVFGNGSQNDAFVRILHVFL